MLLAIDVGNTNTVFAVFDGAALIGQWRMATVPRRTADEYAVWLHQVMGIAGLEKVQIDAAILATVVPEAQFPLLRMCEGYFKVSPLLVGSPEVTLGIKVQVDKPEEAGADRLVNAVEAWRRYGCALIIVDFGTATTFDVVSGQGAYCGGVIAPGVNLSLDALQRAAAKLPTIRVRRPAKVIGTSTIAAMESGIYYGYAAMIEGIVTRIREEYGASMKVIATGGLASLYVHACPVIEDTAADLTIHGLRTIYARNMG